MGMQMIDSLPKDIKNKLSMSLFQNAFSNVFIHKKFLWKSSK